MIKNELFKELVENANNLYFEYNNKKCGIESEFIVGLPIFEMWCGDKIKKYYDFESLISDPFYDGKTLLDVVFELKIF